MKLGRVTGSVVAAQKTGNTVGCKILAVSFLNEELIETGKVEACIDTTSAGYGDVVLMVSSSSARMTKSTMNVCTDNTIVAIVDNISCAGTSMYKAGIRNNGARKC